MRTDSREFNLSGLERVVSGAGSVERLSHELERRGLERAVVVTGRTLGASALLDRVTGPLGSRCVGVFTDAQQHVPSCSVARVVSTRQRVAPRARIGVALTFWYTSDRGRQFTFRYSLAEPDDYRPLPCRPWRSCLRDRIP